MFFFIIFFFIPFTILPPLSLSFMYEYIVTLAEREVKDSRRSGMYQSWLFLARLGTQSL